MVKGIQVGSFYHVCKQLLLTTVIICNVYSELCIGSVNYCEKESNSTVSTMKSVYIPKLTQLLKHSVNALSPSVPFEEEDEKALATLVFESMYTSGRVYHSMQHVFNILEDNSDSIGDDPMLILSVIFHDIIYYSVDKEFQPAQLKILESILAFDTSEEETEDGEKKQPQLQQPLALSSEAQDDPVNDMTIRLFGLEAGMTLPKLGTNEFLSAAIGVRVLSKWLSHIQLTQLAACIEGTIPFRPPSSDGKTAMDRLYDRLVTVAPNQPEDWLVQTIHYTAAMANCDLSSFDSFNFDFFLDSNWSLTPEWRPAILKEDCPLKEYHDEFMSRVGGNNFLLAIVPNIFQAFRNVPTVDEIAAKQDQATKNLKLVDRYAQVRRLQLMILMEFVTIVGDNPDTIPGRPFLQLDVPETHPYSKEDDDEVRKLLHNGRRESFDWDPAKCTLGTYLYDKLGKKGVDSAVEVGKNNEVGSCRLLNHLPEEVVEVVASSLVKVMPNRSIALSQVFNKLGISEKVIDFSDKVEVVIGEQVTCTSAE